MVLSVGLEIPRTFALRTSNLFLAFAVVTCTLSETYRALYFSFTPAFPAGTCTAACLACEIAFAIAMGAYSVTAA